MFPPSLSGVGGVLWQSGLFLIVGLAASSALRRRPARAHRVLLLAILGALIAPLGSQLAHRQGWRLWGTAPVEMPPSPVSPPVATPPPVASAPGILGAGVMRTAGPTSPAPERSGPAARSPIEGWAGSAGRSGVPARVPLPFRDLVLGAWFAVSGLCLVRLVVSMILGFQVVGRARPIACGSLSQAAESAATRLGLRAPPDLRASACAACPAIWCWGRRPIILLPENAAGATALDWTGIFCHELAHWVRRDHWSGLLAEILACLFPWQPLAWWAQHRLSQLSELACDDWAIAIGREPVAYAESLLGLIPRRRGGLALAAVSSRRGLISRVRYILEGRQISPEVGGRWACTTAAAMVLAASAVALAQSRPAPPESQRPRSEVAARREDRPQAAPRRPEQTTMRHSIRGTVLGPEGQPVPGAEVLWVGYREHKVTPSVLPKDDQNRWSQRPSILARSQVEPSGRYTLTADFDVQEFISSFIVVSARGFGLQSHYLKKYGEIRDNRKPITDEVTFRLAREALIRGRLLTPAGAPASGARITLVGFQYKDESRQGMFVGRMATDEEIPPYWPRPRTTDAEGRFTLEGVPQGAYATLTFQHPDYAVDEITINTTGDDTLTPMLRAFELTPAQPTFTHALEPARPVQGRVTDKATGKPLASILVEMIPMRQHGGNSFHARTDADGRYRVSGHQADTYITTVYPPGDSGYLVSGDRQHGWPAGAKVLEKDFALEKGRIVRGHVFDADTRRPIAGAAIIYQPKPGNPHSRNRSVDRSNPVLTDADGRFAVTGLPGEGDLLVETTGGYIRTQFPQRKSGRWALFPHGSTSVSVPEKGEVAPVEITVRKGVTFTARVVGPDGKPVTPFAALCPGLSGNAIYRGHNTMNYPDDRFIFPGADPNRAYRVIFTSARHQLAAVVEIRADPKAPRPVEIRLQPAARVRGKVVNPSGTPMLEGQVYPIIVLDQKTENLSRSEVLSQEIYSNLLESSAGQKYQDGLGAHGEFTHDALVPGMPFYIVAASGGREAFHYVPPLKPGEDRDLGTITLKERQP
jgi:beta-lactamase regulating signal transducer with metallopeptidase domain